MSYIVKHILIDSDGKSVGACVQDTCTGEQRNISKANMKNAPELDNALVDKNGYVRAKIGYPKLKYCLLDIKPNTSKLAEHQNDIKIAKDLINKPCMEIYHGTKEPNLTPDYGKGKENNDYGAGFYTTPNIELAKEWAWSGYTKGEVGYVYTYKLNNLKDMNILNLTEYDSIHWIAELVANRPLNFNENLDYELFQDNMDKLIKYYKLDTDNYDVIIGYRADDSYFQYAKDFIQGRIYKEQMEKALRLGVLGLQVFIKSKKAFSNLEYLRKEAVDRKYEKYYFKRNKRAGDEYCSLRGTKTGNNKTTIYDYISGVDKHE